LGGRRQDAEKTLGTGLWRKKPPLRQLLEARLKASSSPRGVYRRFVFERFYLEFAENRSCLVHPDSFFHAGPEVPVHTKNLIPLCVAARRANSRPAHFSTDPTSPFIERNIRFPRPGILIAAPHAAVLTPLHEISSIQGFHLKLLSWNRIAFVRRTIARSWFPNNY